MKAPYKLLWLYILDECDHAGIWQIDIEVAQIKIGEKINIDEAVEQFGERVIRISEDKLFIPDFVEFQYGVLNVQNRAHKSVIDILTKYNLVDEYFKIKGHISPLQGAKDKDKDKDKDKELNSTVIFDFKKIETELKVNQFSTIETMQRNFSLNKLEYDKCVDIFIGEKEKELHKPLDEVLSHFRSWVKINALRIKRDYMTQQPQTREKRML